MSIFSVNFSDIWQTITPPILRQPVQLTWGTSLIKPVQYLRDLIFDDYANGSTYNMYNNTSAYTSNQRVIYTDRGVYENISGSTGNSPIDTNYWRKINNNYIGARERVVYNAQKILYEYALNRWFQCENIYITTLTASTNIFLMGVTGAYSSSMPNNSNLSTSYLGNTYSSNNNADYIIMVPLSAYTGLGITNTERENTIRSFADNYNLAGMIYSVSGY